MYSPLSTEEEKILEAHEVPPTCNDSGWLPELVTSDYRRVIDARTKGDSVPAGMASFSNDEGTEALYLLPPEEVKDWGLVPVTTGHRRLCRKVASSNKELRNNRRINLLEYHPEHDIFSFLVLELNENEDAGAVIQSTSLCAENEIWKRKKVTETVDVIRFVLILLMLLIQLYSAAVYGRNLVKKAPSFAEVVLDHPTHSSASFVRLCLRAHAGVPDRWVPCLNSN